jgi:hypothetical protein
MRIVISFALLLLLSCKGPSKPSVHFDFYPPLPDTSENKRRFFKQLEKENAFFNLATLTQGVDSFELRVHFLSSFDDSKNMLVFKCSKNQWRGFHYFLYPVSLKDVDGHDSTFIDIKKFGDSTFVAKTIIPKCGWEKFSDSIAFYQLANLPTESLIKNFKRHQVLDGGGVEFEIATKSSYRYLFYWTPDVYEYAECKKVIGFLEMLARQLGNDFSWPHHS